MMQSHMTKDMCLIGDKVSDAFCTLITANTDGRCALLSQWQLCICLVCFSPGLRQVSGCKGVCCDARVQRRARHAVPGKWTPHSSCAISPVSTPRVRHGGVAVAWEIAASEDRIKRLSDS